MSEPPAPADEPENEFANPADEPDVIRGPLFFNSRLVRAGESEAYEGHWSTLGEVKLVAGAVLKLMLLASEDGDLR